MDCTILPRLFNLTVLHFVALSLVTSAATVSDAQTVQEATRLDTFRAALADCVATVRKEGHSLKFDMYLTKTNELRGWGSGHDIYLFNKCMEQLGYDVQVAPEGK
jgi:hypothetical protein